ncbi:MAG: hypothetical protein FWC67_01675 [Defluviitaleaceae bacterium]|nr:hypothetical protein [Defluviitaleaceae bacterium]
MSTIKSSWHFSGKSLIIMGFASLALLFLFALIRGMINQNFDFFVLFIALIPIFIGFFLIIAGKYGDSKLKRLKKTGKAIVPVKIVTRSSGSYASLSRFWIDDGSPKYASFRVICILKNSKGKEIIVKSRKLAVCEGTFRIVPQHEVVPCEAMVYLNPRKPHDFAVDVWLT